MIKKEYFLVVIFLFAWYFFAYNLFIYKDEEVGDSPQLRARLGTILWHSSDKDGKTGDAASDPTAVAHTYCYYPKSSTIYTNKGGEYIIKRTDDGDCSGWMGEAVFHEGSWVSEKEKIWWNKNQKLEEQLATNQQKSSNI
jgi:hypothetical protein